MRAALPFVVICFARLALAQPAEEPGRAGPSEADRALEARLYEAFSLVGDLEKVKVTVRASVVRLEGATATAEPSEKAEKIATKMPGVSHVENNITETAEVGERVSPALRRLRDLGARLASRAPLYGVAFVIGLAFLFLGRLVARSEPR